MKILDKHIKEMKKCISMLERKMKSIHTHAKQIIADSKKTATKTARKKAAKKTARKTARKTATKRRLARPRKSTVRARKSTRRRVRA